MSIYDDSGERNVPFARHTDGPGSLMTFAGRSGSGQWVFSEVDNAATHVARTTRCKSTWRNNST